MTIPPPPPAPVTEHYRQKGLEARLLQALQDAGHDLDNLPPDALAGAEHFHLAGRAATDAIIEGLALTPDAHLLDVGCGIGGPARAVAQATGCRVTGVDLTEAFVASANALSQRMGLAERTSFQLADAAALPFDDASFDAVMLIHVGMNIEDKAGLVAEMARVARPGAAVLIYDVMRVGEGELSFPLPWASDSAHSFLAPQRTYQDALRANNLTIESTIDRTAMAREAVMKARANPPNIGLIDLMGPGWPAMFGNLLAGVQGGIIAPIEIIARR